MRILKDSMTPAEIFALARINEQDRIIKMRAARNARMEKFRKAALDRKPVITTTPSGLTMHRLANKAVGWMEGNKTIASARNVGRRTWLLRIQGHQWLITPDMPSARFQRIPGGKGEMLYTVVKGFPSWQACAKEVERVRASG